jgi:hypothetical protein
MCKKGKETMNTLEIYFWLLLPVYLVGALTIANWLASWTDYYFNYKRKQVSIVDNELEVIEVVEEEKEYQLLPFSWDSKENLALHLQTMKLHDLISCIREVGVDEMTWETTEEGNA